MASSPPHSAPKTAAMDCPAPHPPPRGHRTGEHASNFPNSPHSPQPHAPLSNPQPRRRRPNGRSFDASADYVVLTVVGICCIVIIVKLMSIGLRACAPYPILKVAGLTLSNLTVSASTGATWKAALMVEKPGIYGKYFFREVECFVYYHWDTAQPLAVASAKSFVLPAGANRIVIKAKMTMERPEKAVAEDMDRERRSMGTVAVGLGLRMRGMYMDGILWEKSYFRSQARCDNLRVAFANSTVEGSLVAGGNLVSGDDPLADNLPRCSYSLQRC